MHKSTIYSSKNGPKNCPQLILYMDLKTEVTKRSRQIFRVTIVYLKENSKIKKVFQEHFYPEKKNKLFFGLQNVRVDLYTG